MGLIRFRFVVIFVLLLFAIMGWRLIELTMLERNFLLKQSDARAIRNIPVAVHRGMILDRNNVPLAISTPTKSLWINPSKAQLTGEQISKIASLTNQDANTLKNRMAKRSKNSFMYIKRRLSIPVAEKLAQLQIADLGFQTEYRRYYPESNSVSQLLGFTNIDDVGQEGIEFAYNKWLNGSPGQIKVTKDRLGNVVSTNSVIKEAEGGHDLHLSIDQRLQFSAYSYLKEGVLQSHAESGSVIIVDVNTGEILAVTNYPSYNPNLDKHNKPSLYRNLAVTDLFEPGSTIKTFSTLSALLSDKFTPETKINTSPGYMKVEDNTISDEHNDLGEITLADVLKRSSNVGMTKVTLSLPAANLITNLAKFGFGSKATTDLPGEAVGFLPSHLGDESFELATLSFGYGISVTVAGLAKAYMILANGGYDYPLSITKLAKLPHTPRVIGASDAKQMLDLLTQVVESKNGTGILARVKGIQVAGKTGTANIFGSNGYKNDHYMASFVGISPADAPRLVTVVIVKNPLARQHFGGLIAAPIYAKIVANAVNLGYI